jgi:hypothetical protein
MESAEDVAKGSIANWGKGEPWIGGGLGHSIVNDVVMASLPKTVLDYVTKD